MSSQINTLNYVKGKDKAHSVDKIENFDIQTHASIKQMC
jgi:hypothetical protein